MQIHLDTVFLIREDHFARDVSPGKSRSNISLHLSRAPAEGAVTLGAGNRRP
jgi:hypothetical protein